MRTRLWRAEPPADRLEAPSGEHGEPHLPVGPEVHKPALEPHDGEQNAGGGEEKRRGLRNAVHVEPHRAAALAVARCEGLGDTARGLSV